MVNFTCNSTLEYERIVEEPLWHGVDLHTFGLWFSAATALLATVLSAYLIFMHATHYQTPREQRQIIRIVFMIPVYALVSFLSYKFYWQATYFEVIRDCYEAFAIASFFTLLCTYVAPTVHEQKEYFRQVNPKNWFLGVFWLQKCTGGEYRGPFRKPKSGLTWFNVVWVGVFQYCFIRVFFTIVSVITQATGRYCEESLSPVFAHVWVEVFEGASVTVAMFCLIQFYIQLRTDLAAYKPGLKVLCIKLVIFFSFWQTLVISFLSSTHGPLKPTPKIHYQDIKVGIPSMLLCAEMVIFAVLHLFAFSWKPYSNKHQANPNLSPADAAYKGGFLGIKAFMDAFNPWDLIKASARGFRWLFVGVRKRHEDISYQQQGIGINGQKLDNYEGITFAGNGESATETSSYDTKPRPYAPVPPNDEDSAGLLSHAQGPAAGGLAPPYLHSGSSSPEPPSYHFSPPGTAVSADHGIDMGSSRPYPPPAGSPHLGNPYSDTGYHGAAGQPTLPNVQPAQQPHDPAWDMFAGARPGGPQQGPPPFPGQQQQRRGPPPRNPTQQHKDDDFS